MEFLNGIFTRGFWAYTRVFSDSSFCLVFYPHFSFLQNDTFRLADFFACIFKTKVESGFPLKSVSRNTVNSMWSKRLESFLKLMSKNSISGSAWCPSCTTTSPAASCPLSGTTAAFRKDSLVSFFNWKSA
jgi:hypothetical protein